jgi:hypothetical protein
MIHSMSCHPVEHKFAGINYLINRITTYPVTNQNIDIEEQTINHLLKINGYHYLNVKNLIQHKQLRANEDNNKAKNINKNHNKWAVFTYVGKETRFITKLFKEFNVNISFRTRNTIENILTKQRSLRNQYVNSGVYVLKSQNCPSIYIGQTGRKFRVRYKEHIEDTKSNKSRTGFSQHILNTGHACDTMENTMEILSLQEKGQYLNTLERFHKHKTNKVGGLLSDNYIHPYNPFFESICSIRS